jgi:hypothetical protein
MNMVLQLHTKFNEIDEKNYSLYLENQKKLSQLLGNNNIWDMMNYSIEDNKLIAECHKDIQDYGYISLIFRHISIEGFINDIGIRYLNREEFNESIEKMSFLEKIATVYEKVSNKKFPKGDKIYSKLSDLNSIRNNLVHMKSGEIKQDSLMNLDEEDFHSLINSMMGNNKNKVTKQKFYLNVLEETVGLYDELGMIFYKEVQK